MVLHHVSPLGPDGIVRCYVHNLQATKRVSRTTINPDREFYRCPLPTGEQCDFFCWKDELPDSVPPSTPPMSTTTHLPQTPQPPNSPSKRTHPTCPESRQKRLKAIENALATNTSNTGSSRTQVPPTTPQSTRASRFAKIQGALMTPQSPTYVHPRPVSPSPTKSTSTTSTLSLGNQTTVTNSKSETIDSEENLWRSLPSPPLETLATMDFKEDKRSETAEEEDFFKGDSPKTPTSNLFSPLAMSAARAKRVIEDLTDIPRYINTLEDEVTKLQKVNVEQARRIKDLEKQIERLELEKQSGRG